MDFGQNYARYASKGIEKYFFEEKVLKTLISGHHKSSKVIKNKISWPETQIWSAKKFTQASLHENPVSPDLGSNPSGFKENQWILVKITLDMPQKASKIFFEEKV